jgi:hypothetical protein
LRSSLRWTWPTEFFGLVRTFTSRSGHSTRRARVGQVGVQVGQGRRGPLGDHDRGNKLGVGHGGIWVTDQHHLGHARVGLQHRLHLQGGDPLTAGQVD